MTQAFPSLHLTFSFDILTNQLRKKSKRGARFAIETSSQNNGTKE
jgi:hypothetical protein